MGRMAEQQRKLLEQMMGPEAMGVNPVQADWWDPKVCRNFLCGTCPHDVFGNTKMDLGPCPRIHNEKIRDAFNEAKLKSPLDPRFAAFEQEYQNNIYAFIEDVDRRIRAAQRKLEKTPEENRRTLDLMKEIGEIELAIQGVNEEIEQLGEAGKVEESMAKLQAVEALKTEKEEKEAEMQRITETGGASGHQKLRVCETCGAFLSTLDSDRRLADHFGGKMHLGYHELRKKLEEFNEQRQAARMGLAAKGGPVGRPGAAPPVNAPSGPSGPRHMQPPPGPYGPGYMGPPAGPSTPHRHSTASAVEQGMENELEAGSIAPGYGDKRKREALELMEDSRSRGSKEDDRDRKRYRDSSRERERDRDYRSGDRDREHRHRSDRDDRDRRHDDRDRRYDSREKDRDYRKDRDRERRDDPKDKYREDFYGDSRDDRRTRSERL